MTSWFDSRRAEATAVVRVVVWVVPSSPDAFDRHRCQSKVPIVSHATKAASHISSASRCGVGIIASAFGILSSHHCVRRANAAR